MTIQKTRQGTHKWINTIFHEKATKYSTKINNLNCFHDQTTIKLDTKMEIVIKVINLSSPSNILLNRYKDSSDIAFYQYKIIIFNDVKIHYQKILENLDSRVTSWGPKFVLKKNQNTDY